MNDYTKENPFDKINERNETLLWTGKPKFIPFISGMILFFFLTVGGGTFIYFMVKDELEISNPLFFLACFGPVAIGLWNLFSTLLTYPQTFYAYTEKKVLIRTGVQGQKFIIIEMDKILEIYVRSSFLERAFDSGTIKFYTGRTKMEDEVSIKVYESWKGISNYLEVYRELKRVLEQHKQKN